MQRPKRIQSDPMATDPGDGRDELNLAEFPLCALAHRVRPEQKTLQFQDRIRDGNCGESVTRQLTVSGSDAYGLPTALDDEVLLALIQLTRQRGFADRKVPFTRYQLIALLGWRNETKSYQRIEASLNRWTGVTLHYRNAWWNKARRCWVDQTFHVLDNVWLCHRGSPEIEPVEDGSLRSAFSWNEVVFRSFQAGNLKAIDFEFYKRLDSAVAKRLFRFLDKRFFRRHRLDFDLRELACEHVGLAHGYDVASLKRKLRPALAELEHKGFLQPLGESDRFVRLGSGEWRVVFAKGMAEPVSAPAAASASGDTALVAALVKRGVSCGAARRTAQRYTAEGIRLQLEVFDWLVARSDPRVARNPPGFLISAIKEQYAPPREFVVQAEREQQVLGARQRRQEAETRREDRARHREQQEHEQTTAIKAFWAAVPEAQKASLETEALGEATAAQRKMMEQPGRIGAAARQAVLDAWALAAITRRASAAETTSR